MATIQSSTEHLTLNADGAGKDIKFQANGVEKASIDSSGNFTSTSIDATKLSGALPAIDGSALTGITTGKVLQVVSVTKSDLFTLQSQTFTDVTGLAATITPTSTSSTILIVVNMMMSAAGRYTAVKLLRGSTIIGVGDAAGSRSRVTMGNASNHDEPNQTYIAHNASATYEDSPATTSATTYKIQVGSVDTSNFTIKVNSSSADADAAYTTRGISTITLMEIGA